MHVRRSAEYLRAIRTSASLTVSGRVAVTPKGHPRNRTHFRIWQWRHLFAAQEGGFSTTDLDPDRSP
jgi:hypothetical protein